MAAPWQFKLSILQQASLSKHSKNIPGCIFQASFKMFICRLIDGEMFPLKEEAPRCITLQFRQEKEK